jgi:DNA modification methylase
MQIDYILISELRPHPSNARTHSKRQIRQIANSIRKFGFNNPVLVDDGQKIVAGHGRVEAAKLLGMETVPTCRLSHLSEADKRAYILADNKLAEKAGWDRELLAIELQGLIDLDFEIELTGFELPEIELLLEEAREVKGASKSPEDQVPRCLSGPVVTQTGDLWLLGNHRLLCADARDQAAYEKLLEGAKAEFAFTDPPCTIAIEHNVADRGRVGHQDFAGNGKMKEAEFIAFLETVFERLSENTMDGAIHQVCMDWRRMWEVLAAGRKIYSELKNVCVWNKTNAGMGSFYRSKHELIFVWKSGAAAQTKNFRLGLHARNRTNVWDYPNVQSMRADGPQELVPHPRFKPVGLVADAIKDCSRRGALVLDPFCGSGSVLIAAERTGRKARAMEVDPAYVDAAVRRWQDYTGRAAVLAASGETFDSIGEQHSARMAAA